MRDTELKINKSLKHIVLIAGVCAAVIPTLGYVTLWYVIGAIVGG